MPATERAARIAETVRALVHRSADFDPLELPHDLTGHATALLLTGEHGAGPPLHRAEAHQATGVLAVQLRIALDQALLRLRGHAYSQDRALLDVARDIIAHRLRLDDGSS
ncbi:ANTAR domain-containing protein [Streptomyces sp. Ac-502]|uniref:ANTAR domain-containing protein n=1 Tax=Streptomyces sp. Ac-502 TaxID=3342801 RepID=UPI003862A863